MRSAFWAATAVISAAVTHAATLVDVCTSAYVQASLPSDDIFQGLTIDPSSATANAIYNASVSDEIFYPDAVFDYCNVTFAYSHEGRDDQVLVQFWMPTPSKFQNRYLSTGGGGYAIYTGASSLSGGIVYGAVAGATDGGFGSFATTSDVVFLLSNGTIDWQSLFMFGYQAHHELSMIGKQFTKQFFNMSDTKLYSYYQGCSEGGREGWSQVQRYGDEWDGAAIGAPAIRFSFQQVQHLWSNVVEQTLDYYPPSCEFDTIINETLAVCDPMDGKIDGVIGRSDLCKLHFSLESLIGKPYSCAAAPESFSPVTGTVFATPAQNGSVTAKGVEVANKIINGMQDSQGRQVYLSYQPGAVFGDGQTLYNSTTGLWELSISGLGAEFVSRYLELVNSSSLATLDGVTYDTLKDWVVEGWQRYQDTLHTTWPDLTPFHDAGGKVIHFHGESDNSIPPASSVRYHESVRQIMYPNMSYNDSTTALSEWYRFFLVPGAAHCGPNTVQPNGPFPQTNLAILIDWVEKDIVPVTLNATILQGEFIGDNQQICAWPLRPYWKDNGTTMECQYDQASINTWLYDFDAFNMPVY